MSSGNSTFERKTCESEFCSNCGSVLVLPVQLYHHSVVKCESCSYSILASMFDGITSKTRVVFNCKDLAKKEYKASKTHREEALGPIVDRKCWKCGHDKMSYATLQTRSADEGQTVFYTCIKCGAQENENS
ncbi:DNA-directed RNA polymerase I subunit RPA12 [Halotydeus destructor]|nr:DNA-directed RNA polymerase I subunit RPA12 [Halotydeus destructor]